MICHLCSHPTLRRTTLTQLKPPSILIAASKPDTYAKVPETCSLRRPNAPGTPETQAGESTGDIDGDTRLSDNHAPTPSILE